MIDAVKQLASQGYSKREVCRQLSLSRYALYKMLESQEVKWRPPGKTRNCRARVKKMRSADVRDRMARQAAEDGRAKLYHVGNDRWLTRGQIAREIGGTLQTVAWRIDNGHTGEALLRPADSRKGGRSRAYVYETGLSTSDWEQVLEYAQQRSPRIAAETFGVPIGAVRAMLRGEDWRVE